MISVDPEEYRQAVSGDSQDPLLNLNWKDKPHRLVYDLVGHEKQLRKMLWLSHGCTGLYGDDGEMQCGSCLIDFRRDDVQEIEARFQQIGLQKLAEHQARNAMLVEQIVSSPRSCRCSVDCSIGDDNKCWTVGCPCVQHGGNPPMIKRQGSFVQVNLGAPVFPNTATIPLPSCKQCGTPTFGPLCRKCKGE